MHFLEAKDSNLYKLVPKSRTLPIKLASTKIYTGLEAVRRPCVECQSDFIFKKGTRYVRMSRGSGGDSIYKKKLT